MYMYKYKYKYRYICVCNSTYGIIVPAEYPRMDSAHSIARGVSWRRLLLGFLGYHLYGWGDIIKIVNQISKDIAAFPVVKWNICNWTETERRESLAL